MKKLFIKIALFIGYSIFAGYSAYLTALSLHVNALRVPIWLAFIMVFVLSLLAGWFLTKVIGELRNRTNPSKIKFANTLLGFFVFWGLSFMTNAHANYVIKNGYDNLNKQLQSCISYLKENIYKNEKAIDREKEDKKADIRAKVETEKEKFHSSITDARNGRFGFGDECITILNGIETYLESDKLIFHDANEYVVFDDLRDIGDKGKNSYNEYSILQKKYDEKIQICLEKKYAVIDRFYDNRKENNESLQKTLDFAKQIEQGDSNGRGGLKSLKKQSGFNSFNAYYECYNSDISDLIGKMPAEYKSDDVYPSDRMFDWWIVWKDWFANRLPEDKSFVGQMPIALLIDIAAFILICLI